MKKFAKISGWFIALSILALVCGCGGGGGGGDSGTTPTPTPTPSPNAQLQGDYFFTYYSEVTRELPVNIPKKTITVDGNTGDWAGIAPFISDAQGNHLPNSPTGTDITNVYLAKDSTNLYCRMDLGNGNPNSSVPVKYQVYLPTTVGFAYPYQILQAVYISSSSTWRTELGSWDGTNWQLLATDTAVPGTSCIEMRMSLAALGNPTRRYIQAKTYSSPGGTSTNYDATDTLDGRFEEVHDVSRRESGIGTFTFDGVGGWIASGTIGGNANGTEYLTSFSGTYNVNSDGTVTISRPDMEPWQFGLQKGGKMVVGGLLYNPNNPAQGIMVLFKKGGTHTLTNSQQYFAGFNKDNGGHYCHFGTAILDDVGNVTSTATYNRPSGISTSTSVGTYTRNSDGSGTSTYQQSIGIGVWSGSTWSYNKNIPIVYNAATRDDELFASNVKIDNQNQNRQRINFNIKKTGIPLSNASLKGEFFLAAYSYDNVNTRRESVFGTVTFDGAGNYSLTVTVNRSDSGGNKTGSENGTYSVEADGKVTVTPPDGPSSKGWLNEEGDIVIVSDITDPTRQGVGIAVKSK